MDLEPILWQPVVWLAEQGIRSVAVFGDIHKHLSPGATGVNRSGESPPLDNWVFLKSFVNQILRVQGDLFSS